MDEWFVCFGWVCVNMVCDDINSAPRKRNRKNESQPVIIISVSQVKGERIWPSSCVPKERIFTIFPTFIPFRLSSRFALLYCLYSYFFFCAMLCNAAQTHPIQIWSHYRKRNIPYSLAPYRLYSCTFFPVLGRQVLSLVKKNNFVLFLFLLCFSCGCRYNKWPRSR